MGGTYLTLPLAKGSAERTSTKDTQHDDRSAKTYHVDRKDMLGCQKKKDKNNIKTTFAPDCVPAAP